MTVVAVEGIEPTSLDYQSSALAVELHREVVDPTGLKPAPHGLKGRRSVTRAPGQQELAVAEGFEPSHGRINSAVPYQLGYATREFRIANCGLEAMKGVEPLSSGLQDRRSCFQLSYIAKSFGGAKRSRTSTSCLQGRHHAVRS